MADKRNIVFSTDPDQHKASAGPKKNENAKREKPTAKNNTVYIELERKGRAGKSVTVVSGLSGDLKPLLKALQKHCGTGGSVKNAKMELQGDQRQPAADYLQETGFNVKFKGG